MMAFSVWPTDLLPVREESGLPRIVQQIGGAKFRFVI
jgi:hypothetical protein